MFRNLGYWQFFQTQFIQVIYLKSLATDPTERRKGYATLLVEHLKTKIAQKKDIYFFCDSDSNI